ncbi:MAG: alpha/beta fold hydrolase [Saccharospirillum sp.]|nr:alpha/beta fold hydrolase [Saccharospirillum sp.]
MKSDSKKVTVADLPQGALRALVQDIASRKAEFEQLVALLQPMLVNDEAFDSHIALELSNALHELEFQADSSDALNSLVDRYAPPALVLDDTGRVMASNRALRELRPIEVGSRCDALGLNDSAFVEFKQRLAYQAEATLINLQRNQDESEYRPMLMVGHRDPTQSAYVLVALQQHWPASIERAVAELFRLSPKETEVLAGLACGLTSEQIADQHQRKVTTVRQQTKALLKKMGAANQTQAATLAAAASNAVNRVMPDDASLQLPDQREPLLQGESHREERRIGWRRFGDPNGKKVLTVHGPSFGAGEFEQDRLWAKRCGLDVYAIERPGYGRTDPPHRKDDPLQCQVDDALAVLRQFNVQPESILAHEVGLVPALAISRHLKDSLKHIVGVSCAPPFNAMEQLIDMPAQQGIFILAARKAPWLARLLLRLLVVRLRKLGSERWYQAVFDEVPTDLAVTQRPEFKQGVIATYPFYTRQAGAGFEVDLQVMIQDWGHYVSECDIPLTLLHGKDNPTTPFEYLDIFTELNPKVQIRGFEKNGLTLALSEPEALYRML